MGETECREPRVRKLGCQVSKGSPVNRRRHVRWPSEAVLVMLSLRRDGCECIRCWGNERDK